MATAAPTPATKPKLNIPPKSVRTTATAPMNQDRKIIPSHAVRIQSSTGNSDLTSLLSESPAAARRSDSRRAAPFQMEGNGEKAHDADDQSLNDSRADFLL